MAARSPHGGSRASVPHIGTPCSRKGMRQAHQATPAPPASRSAFRTNQRKRAACLRLRRCRWAFGWAQREVCALPCLPHNQPVAAIVDDQCVQRELAGGEQSVGPFLVHWSFVGSAMAWQTAKRHEVCVVDVLRISRLCLLESVETHGHVLGRDCCARTHHGSTDSMACTAYRRASRPRRITGCALA